MGAVKSKTIWFAVVLAMLGFVQANSEQFQALLSPDAYGWVMVIVGMIVAGLRVMTSQSLADK